MTEEEEPEWSTGDFFRHLLTSSGDTRDKGGDVVRSTDKIVGVTGTSRKSRHYSRTRSRLGDVNAVGPSGTDLTRIFVLCEDGVGPGPKEVPGVWGYRLPK